MKGALYENYESKPVKSGLYSAHRADATRVLLFPEGPSLTRQEFAEDCDLNLLMARYEKTGVISHVSQREPIYADLTDVPSSLAEAMDIIKIAEQSFMTLPATVRREFDNDAVRFVEFASDPTNVDKLREWGLAKPLPVAQEPLAVRVIPDAEPAGAAPAGSSARSEAGPGRKP